ncbi:hypothetical protein JCM19237_3902 [Photobacterium aphoticum]|uniref:Uncharacterized protein n=1 Tax=Photobacterium aphoticum TaxID=754436 RepID=A0A090QVB6_9GAMM|nr:hypothetical protein JCM19237_3902 [Photobacterium aphoticum]
MNEWGKGLVLFSALLSPLAMADWLLDVNFEVTGASGVTQSVNTSLSLLPGEETVFLVRQMRVKRRVKWSAVLNCWRYLQKK